MDWSQALDILIGGFIIIGFILFVASKVLRVPVGDIVKGVFGAGFGVLRRGKDKLKNLQAEPKGLHSLYGKP